MLIQTRPPFRYYASDPPFAAVVRGVFRLVNAVRHRNQRGCSRGISSSQHACVILRMASLPLFTKAYGKLRPNGRNLVSLRDSILPDFAIPHRGFSASTGSASLLSRLRCSPVKLKPNRAFNDNCCLATDQNTVTVFSDTHASLSTDGCALRNHQIPRKATLRIQPLRDRCV